MAATLIGRHAISATRFYKKNTINLALRCMCSKSSDNPPGDGNNDKDKLKNLLNKFETSSSKPLPLKKPSGKPKEVQHEGLTEEVLQTAEAIVSGDRPPKPSKGESNLLKKLRSVTKKAKDENQSASDMSSLFKSMQVEATEKKPEPRAQQTTDRFREQKSKKPLTLEQLAFLEKRKKLRREKQAAEDLATYTPTDIFGAETLGIFANVEWKESEESRLSKWRECEQRELRITSTPRPKNLWEEMAVWTEKGMLWQFPINNEQGIDMDKVDPFHEHIFLERHLESWCPNSGPIRHFMEIVCVGLSKNYSFSVEQKLETIDWFRNYFEEEERKEILELSGAYNTE